MKEKVENKISAQEWESHFTERLEDVEETRLHQTSKMKRKKKSVTESSSLYR